MSSPLVTVVMSAYNPLPRITSAVQSVLDQTLSDIELLVVDDGSDVPLESIIPEDSRIRVIRHPENRGFSAATETGVRNARGKWITWVDSDDRVDPSYLATKVAAGDRWSADFVFARLRTTDENGNGSYLPWSPPSQVSTGQVAVGAILTGKVSGGQHVLARLSSITEPSEHSNAYSDTIFVTRNVLHSDTVAYVDDAQYEYFIHQGSVTGRLRESLWDLAKYPAIMAPSIRASMSSRDAEVNISRARVLAVSQMLHKAARERRASPLREEITRWCRAAINAEDVVTSVRDRRWEIAASLTLAWISPVVHRVVYQWYSHGKSVSA